MKVYSAATLLLMWCTLKPNVASVLQMPVTVPLCKRVEAERGIVDTNSLDTTGLMYKYALVQVHGSRKMQGPTPGCLAAK